MKFFTSSQSVGIVASYSYSEIVKPVGKGRCQGMSLNSLNANTNRTINFLLVLHDQEGVVVKVAKEIDIGSARRRKSCNFGLKLRNYALDSPIILVL